MNRLLSLSLLILALVAVVAVDPVAAGGNGPLAMGGGVAPAYTSWHGGYYHSAWGMPVALVVSPKVEFQTQWGWGVANTRVLPICPQFQPGYAVPGVYDRRMFRPTPYWPSDTEQFGVYYIRGPW